MIEPDIADLGAVEARDAIEKGGFAGAVGADDAVDALLLDLDIQVLDGDESPNCLVRFWIVMTAMGSS